MNIFYLDEDLRQNAEYYVDRHVVKMPLEYAQLLCSALYFTGQEELSPYKLTHKNHPCSVWTRNTLDNWKFLKELALEVCQEYRFRYGKTHKCEDVIKSLPVPNIDAHKITILPNCMDQKFVLCNDVIINYRNYYKNGKSHIHQWKNRNVPYWIL